MHACARAGEPLPSPPPFTTADLPARFTTEAELDDFLTRPRSALVESIRCLTSPLVVLGAGGKMGPTLAVLAHRAAEAAAHPLEVIAVSRFGGGPTRAWLEARGVKTLSCDLLAPNAAQHLPDTSNLVYLVGLKFGTARNPAATWAVNTLAPLQVAQRYPRARIVVLSTGNVYPLGPASAGGATEEAPLTPLGEYANAAVARERLFQFCAERNSSTIALLRLFYAVDLRYGILVDLAKRVARGEPIDLTSGYFNCIWQGDANEMVLRALALASNPPSVWNLCRPEVFPVRTIAEQLGVLLGRAPVFQGLEAATALLGNSARLCAALGPPATPLEATLHWTAHWVARGGRDWGKPTHFEVRDGRY